MIMFAALLPFALVAALTPQQPESLAFVSNAGQTDRRVVYYAQGSQHAIYFTHGGVVFDLTRRQATAMVANRPPTAERFSFSLNFAGANPRPRIEARGELGAKVHYFTGNNSAAWRTGLSTWREVVYRDLWPGVDMVFHGAGGKLKYELVARPGARPSQVRLRYRGVRELSLDQSGDLLIATAAGIFRDERPLAYQLIGEHRQPIPARFALTPGPDGETLIQFETGPYDRRYPLVIDPGLTYSTFLGGSGMESSPGIALTPTGEAYVAGSSNSLDYPTTLGALDQVYNGGTFDVVLSKLDSNGTTLLFSTYLGGSSFEFAEDLTIDSTGNAYLIGRTGSVNFPTTEGAYDRTYNGGSTDFFVAKLDPTGSALAYSTFVGGSNFDLGVGIAVDVSGNAYLTGTTGSTNFPTTFGAFDRTFNGGFQDAFVAKLDSAGANLLYSTYLGGSFAVDVGERIAVDSSGQAHVVGFTDSSNFPVTADAFDRTFNGGPFTGKDVFVTKLDSNGASLLYSTFLGGSGREFFSAIALDGLGNAYLTGRTASANFPTTPGAFDRTFDGNASTLPEVFDGFVTKLNANGDALVYSTFLGGSQSDTCAAIVVDGSGSAYVGGATGSPDFPTTCSAVDRTFHGNLDGFAARLDPAGATLLYGTYLGSPGLDAVQDVALDGEGNLGLGGLTNSADFPTTEGAFDRTYNGGSFDLFAAVLAGGGLSPQGAIESILDSVEELAASGALNEGQANSLTVKLEAAIAQLNSGNTNAAINQLEAFLNQVNALVRAGVLSPAEAEILRSSANCVSEELQ
jgi:hypothetical protein